MGIGTSLGAFYDDEFHYQQSQHDPKKYDTNDNIERTPNDVQTGKALDAAETDPSTGMGLEVNLSLGDRSNDYDYDSWQAANPGVEMAPGQHYPDTYKLPNHMTFSDESIYNKDGAEGGHWGLEDGKDTFTPGKTNLENHSPDELRDYFKRVEPDTKLILK